MLELYLKKKNYITLEELASYFHVCSATIQKAIKETGAYEGCPDVFRHLKNPLHQFDIINEESAYWLGYLMADGCYTLHGKNRNGYRLMLECKVEDREILEKFCDFLQVRKERITFGHNNRSVCLSFTDNIFSTSVSTYGITYNKSHTENHVPKIILENDNLFWQYFRGIIDGDGTIHTYHYSPGISFVSNSKIFVEEITQKVREKIPVPSAVWISERTVEQQKGRKATQNIYSMKIGVGGHKRLNSNFLYQTFYKNQNIILTRKWESFQKII